ncbi:hypothetical protein WL99_14130 [Burkholderia cepacia]|uniref:OmpA family protein n=1 Tax=Burkholderia cepacia TaxID=292 RepID=UPI000754014F|nr:OmpA family protein [Burkholderia cepacia]KWH30892.1 hypothetical protein WL99_14130 [Burkholderia cepacia]
MIKSFGINLAPIVLALLAGCSSMSGPTYSAWSIDLQNGEQAYRVDCYGLLEGAQVCQRKAEEICNKRPVRLVQGVAGLGADGSRQLNTRELTFQCGVASVAESPAPPSLVPSPTASKVSLREDTTFQFDQAVLTSAGRDRLNKLLDDAQGTGIDLVTVIGYTDDVGTDDYNQHLSERRAAVIAAYLSEHGLHARQFVVRGYGKLNPVASNATAGGRAQNRRVEILLDSSPK